MLADETLREKFDDGANVNALSSPPSLELENQLHSQLEQLFRKAGEKSSGDIPDDNKVEGMGPSQLNT